MLLIIDSFVSFSSFGVAKYSYTNFEITYTLVIIFLKTVLVQQIEITVHTDLSSFYLLVKRVILSHEEKNKKQKKNKNNNNVILIKTFFSFEFKCLTLICICYLVEFKYFNYIYIKKK